MSLSILPPLTGLIGLGLLIAAELAAPAGGTLVERTAPDSGAETIAAAPPAPSDHGADLDAWTATVLARPLFREDRAPPRSRPAVVESAHVTPRLIGIMVGPFGKVSLFRFADGAKPVVLHENEQTDGLMVRLIEAGQVIVSHDGKEESLSLPPFQDGSKTVAGRTP